MFQRIGRFIIRDEEKGLVIVGNGIGGQPVELSIDHWMIGTPDYHPHSLLVSEQDLNTLLQGKNSIVSYLYKKRDPQTVSRQLPEKVVRWQQEEKLGAIEVFDSSYTIALAWLVDKNKLVLLPLQCNAQGGVRYAELAMFITDQELSAGFPQKYW